MLHKALSCFSWAQSLGCHTAWLIWLPGGSGEMFLPQKKHSHFKTKHSLVSRCRKYLCTGLWWLSKRNSQNFDQWLFLPALSKTAMRFAFRQHWTDKQCTNQRQNKFSKPLASVLLQLDTETPLTALNFIGSWGTHRAEVKRGVMSLRLPNTLPVCSFIPLQNFILSIIFSIKEMNQTKTLPACLLPSLFCIPGFYIFKGHQGQFFIQAIFNFWCFKTYASGIERKYFELKWRTQSEYSSACFSSHFFWCDPGIPQGEWSCILLNLA